MNLFQVTLLWKGGVRISVNVARREAAEGTGGGHQRACMFEYLQAFTLVPNEGEHSIYSSLLSNICH